MNQCCVIQGKRKLTETFSFSLGEDVMSSEKTGAIDRRSTSLLPNKLESNEVKNSFRKGVL